MDPMNTLCFLCIFASVLFNAHSPATGPGEWRSLFDGTTLKGWNGDPTFWRAEDGVIIGQSTPEHPCTTTTYLQTDEVFADFELEFMIRLKGAGANSGMQYRSTPKGPDFGDGFDLKGYQADFDLNHAYSGILYETYGRGITAPRGSSLHFTSDGNTHTLSKAPRDDTLKAWLQQHDQNSTSDGWHHYRIIANGPWLQHFINDTRMLMVKDESPQSAAKGILALQVHQGGPMSVEVKNIRIRSIGNSWSSHGFTTLVDPKTTHSVYTLPPRDKAALDTPMNWTPEPSHQKRGEWVITRGTLQTTSEEHTQTQSGVEVSGPSEDSVRIPTKTIQRAEFIDIIKGHPSAVIASKDDVQMGSHQIYIIDVSDKQPQPMFSGYYQDTAVFLNTNSEWGASLETFDPIFADWTQTAEDGEPYRAPIIVDIDPSGARCAGFMDARRSLIARPSQAAYRAALVAAREPSPHLRGETYTPPYQQMIDWCYGGHPDLAWKLLRESWPEDTPGAEACKDSFQHQLNSSTVYIQFPWSKGMQE